MCAANNIGPGYAYEFSCIRISAMDLFEEARYAFDKKDSVTCYKEPIIMRGSSTQGFPALESCKHHALLKEAVKLTFT